MKLSEHINLHGALNAEVLVVADVPKQKVYDAGAVMSQFAMSLFCESAMVAGLNGKNTAFITPCPPLPEIIMDSDRRKAEFLAEYRNEFLQGLKKFQNLKLIIYLGKLAGEQVTGSPVKITKCRGSFTDFEGVPVLPMYSPSFVLTRPENMDVFKADFLLVDALRKAKYSLRKYAKNAMIGSYEWQEDIEHLVKSPPELVVVDSETRGLDWMRNPGIITVQMSWEEGSGICLPWCRKYYPGISEKQLTRLQGQVKKLMQNKKIKKVGHNFKYDMHMLENDGIKVANWVADTIQMAWAVDENMDNFGLEYCARRWVPEKATYSDGFMAEGWYTHMWDCPHDKMLDYAVGDTDVTLRLFNRLKKVLAEDERQMRCFTLIQMPVLNMFQRMERNGIRMNPEELEKLGDQLEQRTAELHESLVKKVPAKVKRKWLDICGGDFNFGTQAFVQDILFGPDGFRLKPVVFTKTTKRLGEEDRVPSISTKQHLPYFEDNPFVQEFIEYTKIQKMRSTYVGRPGGFDLEEIKLTKDGRYPNAVSEALHKAGIRSGRRLAVERPPRRIELSNGRFLLVNSMGDVFKGKSRDAKGFFQHLCGPNNDTIYPSLYAHGTTTGRIASRNPNSMNYPAHGDLAQRFRKVFRPSEGFSFIEADLSQVELRIAAWMSNDPTMLKVFREGGDIHRMTAEIIMGLSSKQFDTLPEKVRDEKRQMAKAVNFGLIFGMLAKGLRSYAKTTYKVEMTMDEAETFRDRYFDRYHYLLEWHKGAEAFAKKHGYVRALHGRVRHLPGVGSDDKWMVLEAVRQAINAPVQGFASDLGVMSMTRYGEDCPWEETHPIGFVHDNVQAEAIKGKEEEYAANLLYYMQSNPLEEWFGITPPIPLIADVKVGYDNLGESVKLKGLKPVRPVWCND